MAGYLERAREDEMQSSLRSLDKLCSEWVLDSITSAFRTVAGGRNPEDVPLREMFRLAHSNLELAKIFLIPFLIDVDRAIREWKMEDLDEDCTIPEVLAALKVQSSHVLEVEKLNSMSTGVGPILDV